MIEKHAQAHAQLLEPHPPVHLGPDVDVGGHVLQLHQLEGVAAGPVVVPVDELGHEVLVAALRGQGGDGEPAGEAAAVAGEGDVVLVTDVDVADL